MQNITLKVNVLALGQKSHAVVAGQMEVDAARRKLLIFLYSIEPVNAYFS